MRKKLFGIITLAMCLLALAGQATATNVPQSLNGTTWYMAGFNSNQTVNAGVYGAAVYWGAQLNSTLQGQTAASDDGLNGTVTVYNSTGSVGENATYFSNTTNGWYAGSDQKYIGGLLALNSTAASQIPPLYFLQSPNGEFLAGVQSGIMVDGLFQGTGSPKSNGTSMAVAVRNSTLTQAGVAGSWYLFSLISNNTYDAQGVPVPAYYGRVGKLTLTAATTGLGTGTLSYYTVNGSGTWPAARPPP